MQFMRADYVLMFAVTDIDVSIFAQFFYLLCVVA